MLPVKIFFPGDAAAEDFFWLATHLAKSVAETTFVTFWSLMPACPGPQSAEQSTLNVPVRSGVANVRLMIPGTASAFTRHSATKKPWITSVDVVSSLTPSLTGRYRIDESKPPS